MTDAQEALDAKTPMAGDLAAGLAQLSANETIEFRLYVRLVLPLDGYVFWVRSDLVSAKVMLPFVDAELVSKSTMPRPVVKAKGSLHYATTVQQAADSNIAVNRMIFTAVAEIQDFNKVTPNLMYVAKVGENIRFAFSSRGSFYRQADLFHYVGDAVYPTLATQLIDDVKQFTTNQVVSDSMPAWLATNTFRPFYGFSTGITLFPAFLSPQNLEPPFGTVDIPPELTEAYASAPTIDPTTSTHTQLCADTVRITLWGFRNDQAMDFLDAIYQYSDFTAAFGIMNVPTVRDERKTQAELGIIAQKKTCEFRVSYLQHRVRTIGLQTIKSCVPNIYVNGVELG